MCSPQAGRVANGIFTLGLSEAVRPMLGGGNKSLFDNMGTLGAAGLPGLMYSESQKQNKQQPSFQQQPFQNPYDTVGQSQTKNQTIR